MIRGTTYPLPDSPVEKRRKELPQGDGSWKGFDHVYSKLKQASEHLGQHHLLSEEHVETMAVMGCGHEETMKGWMHYCHDRGFV